MEIKRFDPPEFYRNSDNDHIDFKEISILIKNHLLFSRVAYWYSSSDYDGTGYIVGRNDDNIVIIDISHCSCYSYEDVILTYPERRTECKFFEIKDRTTEDVYEDIEQLVNWVNLVS